MDLTPYKSLQTGQWVKLICGASYQDMPTVSHLAMIYALAGVDCIDVAADSAVISAAHSGLQRAVELYPYLKHQLELTPPHAWIMVSLNDSEDPHFRKATFSPSQCPPSCQRPCEQICPADAITFSDPHLSGVIGDLCYGCGRCIPVCPVNNIAAKSYQVNPTTISPETLTMIDAVEIHTHTGKQSAFQQLWQKLTSWQKELKLVSVSCPDNEELISYLQDIHAIMAPLSIPVIWQTDGRPMSGDLGRGTTHAAIHLARKVLTAELPGFVQLAGGTNHYTVEKLHRLGIITENNAVEAQSKSPQFAGIAYGSYARQLIMPCLEAIHSTLAPYLTQGQSYQQPFSYKPSLAILRPQSLYKALSESPDFWESLTKARSLVRQLKKTRKKVHMNQIQV